MWCAAELLSLTHTFIYIYAKLLFNLNVTQPDIPCFCRQHPGPFPIDPVWGILLLFPQMYGGCPALDEEQLPAAQCTKGVGLHFWKSQNAIPSYHLA